MELCFNIDGYFITKTARKWFYEERKPFKKVEELLLNCMCGTDIPKQTLEKYVEDVLKFKRKFIGNTQNDTFCLVEDGIIPDSLNKLVKNYDYIKQYGKIPFEVCEYGFINTEGKYIPVEWCKHSQWASEYLKNNYSEKDWFLFLSEYNCNTTDALVKGLNWILIENPQQGEGIIHTGDRITKAQKETLYDYYMFFNRKEEANELYKGDD